LIVIDNLQRIQSENRHDPRPKRVAKITRRLKGLAREMYAPVLCLAQLDRRAQPAKKSPPRLSHLRRSAVIRQEADVILFVHRDKCDKNTTERDQIATPAKVIVAKTPMGFAGDVQLLWQGEYGRFVGCNGSQHDEVGLP
jgi:replicative DNA helicase